MASRHRVGSPPRRRARKRKHVVRGQAATVSIGDVRVSGGTSTARNAVTAAVLKLGLDAARLLRGDPEDPESGTK